MKLNLIFTILFLLSINGFVSAIDKELSNQFDAKLAQSYL